MKIDALIPAAGCGSRFSSEVKKQFYIIEGSEILYYTLLKLKKVFEFNKFIIGVDDEDLEIVQDICSRLLIDNVEYCKGGKLRQHTVYNALLKSSADFVLIHDAVRPFVSADVILKTINTAEKFDFAICGIKLRDSLKIVDKNCIIKSENRERFILSHTPQVFRRKPLENALRYANKNEIVLYDDSQALEIAGSSVKFIESNLYNIKITHIDDIDFAKYLIKNDL